MIGDPKPPKREKAKKLSKYEFNRKYGSKTPLKRTRIKVNKNYRIPKRSKKKASEESRYSKLRAKHLPGKICPCCGNQATDVHHAMGREGYADDWARLKGIVLLLDIRHWRYVCRELHTKIELNPVWAKKNNYSLNRLSENGSK